MVASSLLERRHRWCRSTCKRQIVRLETLLLLDGNCGYSGSHGAVFFDRGGGTGRHTRRRANRGRNNEVVQVHVVVVVRFRRLL